MLEERKKDKNPPNDLLQRLIEATDEDGNHLPDIIIIAEVIIQMYVSISR
jgi:cytochrome P450